jgi:multiple sugar transport system permease protein
MVHSVDSALPQQPAKPKSKGGARAKRYLRRGITYILALMLGLIFMMPFFWAVFSAFKDPYEVIAYPPKLLPTKWRFENFYTVWTTVPFAQWTLNTFFVCIMAVIGQVTTATLVAYGFSRFRFPGRDKLFLLVLSTMMIPMQVTLIPTFLMFRVFGWLNTLKPLFIPSYFGGGAFFIFLLRQFLLTIPRDLDEAAKIDGAGSLRVLLRVILPLAKPAILTVVIFSFMGHWQDFLGPLFYLNSTEKFTLSLGLRFFSMLPMSGRPTNHLLMAASIQMTIPVLLIFFFTQKYFVQGIVTTGLKM